MKIFLTIAFLFMSGAALFAETQTMTLSNAVTTAMRNNRQVLQAEADLSAARAQAGQSFADLWYPHVDLAAGIQFVDQQTVTNNYLNSIKIISNQTVLTYTIPVLVSNQITNAFQDNYALTASVSKTLFAGMRYWNVLGAKNILTEIAELKLANTKKQVAADVSVSFYALLLARENIRLYETLTADMKDRMDDTLAKFSQGMVSEFERIRSEVQFENVQPALERLKNGYSARKIALCNSLGITDADSVEFTGLLTDATNFTILPEAEKSVALALSNDLDLRSADKSLEVLKLNRNIADGGRYPALNAFFNYKFDYKKQNVNDDMRNWGGGWNTGIQLNIPVEEWVPGSRTDQQVKEAEANIAKMTAARGELADGIAARVKTLLIQTAESQSLSTKLFGTSLKARKAYELAKKLYQNGASTALALNDSEIAMTQAKSAWYQEIYNYMERRIALDRMTSR